MQAPVMVMNQNTKRETGSVAQLGNISAARAVSDIVRTTLGPRSMLKMLLDPMGSIVLTNDGNAILREVDVTHPAARSMIDLSRTQDEEVGDGTTTVIVLAGEMLTLAAPLLEKKLHPTVICRGYYQAMDAALKICESAAITVDPTDPEVIKNLVKTSFGTKISSRFGDRMVEMAISATKTVLVEKNGKLEIDLKRYAKVEKIPGGDLEDCKVLRGVMFNKDITHSKMRRTIKNPRILLLDCPLEYKKAESTMNVEITKEEDWEAMLKQEEDYIRNMCKQIIRHKPDLVITEKGLSDLAQHFLVKAGISAIRRLRKTDNNRIARATGATIVHRVEEIQEHDIGKECGLFIIRKIGDEYFTFLEECKSPKACTILLRGASKDILMEMERNLQDAMQVARNVFMDPKLLPGGGAIEMTLSVALKEKAASIAGVEQWAYLAIAEAFEVIPRTLAENCGADIIRIITALRAKHAGGANLNFGINGETGVMADMGELQVWDTYVAKIQSIKTAIEASAMMLRIDDIVSGISKKK